MGRILGLAIITRAFCCFMPPRKSQLAGLADNKNVIMNLANGDPQPIFSNLPYLGKRSKIQAGNLRSGWLKCFTLSPPLPCSVNLTIDFPVQILTSSLSLWKMYWIECHWPCDSVTWPRLYNTVPVTWMVMAPGDTITLHQGLIGVKSTTWPASGVWCPCHALKEPSTISTHQWKASHKIICGVARGTKLYFLYYSHQHL